MSCLVRAFSFSQLQSSSCCQPTSGGPRCSSTAEQRAEPFPPSLSQPPLVHLTFCLEGWDCVRRSPLSLSFFSSLRSWSFTFVSEVTFSTCFSSLLLPLLLVSPSASFFSHYFFIIPTLCFSFVAFTYSPFLQRCTAMWRSDVCVRVCVCVFEIVGGWSSSVGRQRSECRKTVHKQQPRKSKGKVEC